MKGTMNEDYADYGSFQKGNRVRVECQESAYDQREGTVHDTSTSSYRYVLVLIDGMTSPLTLRKISLKRLSEPLRIPTGRREEGKGIRPEDVQPGDTIKVVRTSKDIADIKATTILEGTVGRRTSNGGLVTKDQNILYSSVLQYSTQIITLVSKAPDNVLAEIRDFPVDTILTWRYGKEDTLHVAVKTGITYWQVVGADGSKRVDAATLRTLIERNNDNYSTLREGK